MIKYCLLAAESSPK